MLKFEIPELSDLKSQSVLLAVNRFFRGAGPKDWKAWALVLNYVRLVDLAVTEYEIARKAILEFASSNETLLLDRPIQASGHFETSVTATKRAIDHLKALRSHREVPQRLKDLIPRGIIVLSGNVETKVTTMRHAIQHLEKDIKNGNISPGQAIALSPKEHNIELGRCSIRYSDLADWLRELHSLSVKLTSYWES